MLRKAGLRRSSLRKLYPREFAAPRKAGLRRAAQIEDAGTIARGTPPQYLGLRSE